MTVIGTARLVIRPQGPGDTDGVFAIASHWEVARWTATLPWPPDRAFIAARCAGAQPDEGMIATVLHEGAHIGTATVLRGELGYCFLPSAWRRGFATEACAALVGHAFGTTDWPQVVAGVFDGNVASVRVLEKLGFVTAGPSPSFSRARGEEVAGTDYLLTRAAWNARRPAA